MIRQNVNNFIGSYESAVKFYRIFHPDFSNEHNNRRYDFLGLDEGDIDRIQEILDETDDDDDEEVEFIENEHNSFPMPKKIVGGQQ